MKTLETRDSAKRTELIAESCINETDRVLFIAVYKLSYLLCLVREVHGIAFSIVFHGLSTIFNEILPKKISLLPVSFLEDHSLFLINHFVHISNTTRNQWLPKVYICTTFVVNK